MGPLNCGDNHYANAERQRRSPMSLRGLGRRYCATNCPCRPRCYVVRSWPGYCHARVDPDVRQCPLVHKLPWRRSSLNGRAGADCSLTASSCGEAGSGRLVVSRPPVLKGDNHPVQTTELCFAALLPTSAVAALRLGAVRGPAVPESQRSNCDLDLLTFRYPCAVRSGINCVRS